MKEFHQIMHVFSQHSSFFCSSHVKISQKLKDVFATGLQQASQQVVTMLLFYQLATSLSLTTCYQVAEFQHGNRLLKQLITSLLSSTNL
jgi:hypothetical protein